MALVRNQFQLYLIPLQYACRGITGAPYTCPLLFCILPCVCIGYVTLRQYMNNSSVQLEFKFAALMIFEKNIFCIFLNVVACGAKKNRIYTACITMCQQTWTDFFSEFFTEFLSLLWAIFEAKTKHTRKLSNAQWGHNREWHFETHYTCSCVVFYMYIDRGIRIHTVDLKVQWWHASRICRAGIRLHNGWF